MEKVKKYIPNPIARFFAILIVAAICLTIFIYCFMFFISGFYLMLDKVKPSSETDKEKQRRLKNVKQNRELRKKYYMDNKYVQYTATSLILLGIAGGVAAMKKK